MEPYYKQRFHYDTNTTLNAMEPLLSIHYSCYGWIITTL